MTNTIFVNTIVNYILRNNKTGVCIRMVKSFGELIEHFIIGGDKTCLISEADRSIKIIR